MKSPGAAWRRRMCAPTPRWSTAAGRPWRTRGWRCLSAPAAGELWSQAAAEAHLDRSAEPPCAAEASLSLVSVQVWNMPHVGPWRFLQRCRCALTWWSSLRGRRTGAGWLRVDWKAGMKMQMEAGLCLEVCCEGRGWSLFGSWRKQEQSCFPVWIYEHESEQISAAWGHDRACTWAQTCFSRLSFDLHEQLMRIKRSLIDEWHIVDIFSFFCVFWGDLSQFSWL